MTEDIFEIDRPSAERLYAVLCDDEAISPEAFKLAFTNVLSRKMGADNAPAECEKDAEDNFAKMERLFDSMFHVEMEAMSDEEVAKQAAKASVHLLNEATDTAVKGQNDMSEMYGDDCKDYMLIRAYLEDGEIVRAYKMWRELDTASRDNLYIDLDEAGEERLNKALNRYHGMMQKADKQAA